MGFLQDRQAATYVQDGVVYDNTKINTPYGQIGAGQFTTADPALTNGQFSFFRLTADGKLMVDTELTVTGLTIDNIFTFSTDNTPANARYGLVDGDGHLQVDVLSLPVSITEYDEDSQHTTGDKGIQLLAVRQDNYGTLTDTDGDYSALSVNGSGGLITAGYDSSENAGRTKEVDPVSAHFSNDDIEITGQPTGTYEYFIELESRTMVGLQIIDSSGAGETKCDVRVYLTAEPDTPQASCTYEDASSDLIGAAPFDLMAAGSQYFVIDVPVIARFLKVEIDYASGASDGAWTINYKTQYAQVNEMGYTQTSQLKLDEINNQFPNGFNTIFTAPSADSANNSAMRDVIGNKTDTVAGSSIVARAKKISARVKPNKTKGTYSHTGDATEEDVVEITPAVMSVVQGVWLDLVNMTQNGTIILYYKIDGINYREVLSQSFTVATDSDGVYLNVNMGIVDDFKVTYKPSVGEGGAKNIPYLIVYNTMEQIR